MAQVNVSGSQTAIALAQKLAGEGITVSNPTLKCPGIAYGTFNVVSSNLPIDSGIVLTTGRAATQSYFYGINGPSSVLASSNNSAAGDPQLSGLSGQNTYDACALEFDLVPAGDTLSFNYVFSSEEYISAVCGKYNDAFAFFISGPGINGSQNIALVPGTNIPVTINSINNGIPSGNNPLSNCTSMGMGSPFTSFYIDNSNGTSITHQGMTTVFKAAHLVQPCSTYHLKLVIADGGNALYDSGVFLQAGSLRATNYSVQASAAVSPNPNIPLPYVVKGCAPGHFTVKRMTRKTTPETIHLSIGGTAVNGFDYAAIADSVVIPANDTVAQVSIQGLPTPLNGPKTVKIGVKSPYVCYANSIVDSASIVLYDTIHLKVLTPDTAICSGNTMQIRVDGDSIIQYSWQPDVAIDGISFQSPVIHPAQSETYTLTASLPGTGCPVRTASVHITVNASPQVSVQGDTTVCSNATLLLSANAYPPYSGYHFQWTGPYGFTASGQQYLIKHTSNKDYGWFVATVSVDTSNCIAKDSFVVTITSAEEPMVTSPFVICQNEPVPAFPVTGSNLLWYTQSDSTTGSTVAPTVSSDSLTSYTFYVSQETDGCESDKKELDIAVKHCCEGIVLVPSGFTPNGDGRNDLFRLTLGYGYKVVKMYVFNRWGQTIFEAYNNNGWDGTWNGTQVDTGDYFYDILVSCVDGALVEKKGDVLVIR